MATQPLLDVFLRPIGTVVGPPQIEELGDGQEATLGDGLAQHTYFCTSSTATVNLPSPVTNRGRIVSVIIELTTATVKCATDNIQGLSATSFLPTQVVSDSSAGGALQLIAVTWQADGAAWRLLSTAVITAPA